MSLEKLVPQLDLCKLIPAGEFEDSAFVWIEVEIPQENKKEWRVVNATKPILACHNPKHPAPTLHEIMAELSLCDVYCDTGWFCMVGSPDHWSIGNCECDLYVRNGTENNSPEASAIKVWLKLKGIDCEQKQS